MFTLLSMLVSNQYTDPSPPPPLHQTSIRHAQSDDFLHRESTGFRSWRSSESKTLISPSYNSLIFSPSPVKVSTSLLFMGYNVYLFFFFSKGC